MTLLKGCGPCDVSGSCAIALYEYARVLLPVADNRLLEGSEEEMLRSSLEEERPREC